MFQLVTPMTEEILLGISHLLFTLEAIHAGHQCRHSMLSPVASGHTIDSNTFSPGTDTLPCNQWVRWNQCLIKDHWMVKLILHQVDLSQDLLHPEMPQWDRISWP